MNRESSRSHAVFTITLESKKKVCVACKGEREEGREGCLVGGREGGGHVGREGCLVGGEGREGPCRGRRGGVPYRGEGRGPCRGGARGQRVKSQGCTFAGQERWCANVQDGSPKSCRSGRI